jgi:acyl-CoA synthetase (AMP-forming)/AMP-acid ligase II
VAKDCQASVALSLPSQRDIIEGALLTLQRPMAYIAVDLNSPPAVAESFRLHSASPDELAFIQYTSGSTSAPKGVMVSHRNLAANLAMMGAAFVADSTSTYVGWAPLYHDMGLIANVLQPFNLGALCVLMTPASFAQRPWLWLKAISDYRAHISGGPNSAYDICIDRRERVLAEQIDLSCWRLAFNSAEPVRAETLARFAEVFAPVGFRAQAMYPCYGLADATLLVSGGTPGTGPKLRDVSKTALAANQVQRPSNVGDICQLVGAGRALTGEHLRIIDPVSLKPLPDGEVGEVVAAGAHIPAGYWNKPDASQTAFHARLPGEEQRFLRTGDLGFLLDGELYITGRIKDVIIVRGRNLYPQDLELIAERAYPGLRRNSGAAFICDLDPASSDSVVLVQEVERTARRSIDQAACRNAIRKAINDEFEVSARSVVLVEPGSLPKTSSGKIQRSDTRRRFLANELDLLGSRQGLHTVEPDVPAPAAK